MDRERERGREVVDYIGISPFLICASEKVVVPESFSATYSISNLVGDRGCAARVTLRKTVRPSKVCTHPR